MVKTKGKRGRPKESLNKHERNAKKASTILAFEPRCIDENHSLALALNWYNLNVEDDKLRSYTIEFVESTLKNKEFAKSLKKFDETEFHSLGALIRMIQNGLQLPNYALTHVSDKLKRLKDLKIKAEVVKATEPKKVVNIQDRIKAKAAGLMGEIDGAVDEVLITKKTDFDIRKYLSTNQVNGPMAKQMSLFYQSQVKEFQDVLEESDQDLVYAYDIYTKSQIKKVLAFLQDVVLTCNELSKISIGSRKPRAKKVKPAAVLVAKMKFQKENKDYKIQSIDPAKIVGADELWVFNVKLRKLTILKASYGETLMVKGSTILNIDQKESLVKNVRKPEELFKKIDGLTKRSMNGAFKDLNAKPKKAKARINKDMVLLKVF